MTWNYRGLEKLLIWKTSNDEIEALKKRGFCINGWINHYHDFIVCSTKGTIIIIETKGDDRDNSDSIDKLKLGQTRASVSGFNFKYFMVFQQNSIPGSHMVEEVLKIIASL